MGRIIIQIIKKIFNYVLHRRLRQSNSKSSGKRRAVTVSSNQHSLHNKQLSRQALTVLQRLHQANHQAYLVGGSVRDLLLGIKPKDFDIATDAHPETVRGLFRNSRLIGRRFRLVHVFFGQDIIEVATFRGTHPEESHPDGMQSDSGMILRDNIYGDMEEDAWRRDFSINALYYNSADGSIIDYTGGMGDLEKRLIRVLGDPLQRYREDPVRMLRALRLAAKLDFVLDADTAKAILELNQLLKLAAPARLFDEILKLFYCGHGMRAFRLLCHYGFFGLLFPQCAGFLAEDNAEKDPYISLILHSCKNTDHRLAQDQSLNPAFLYAVMLWPAFQHKFKRHQEIGQNPQLALQQAAQKVLAQQTRITAIPRRYSVMIQEIWQLQRLLELKPKKRIISLFSSSRFRAAYDFLVLRLESGQTHLEPTVTWWQEFQSETEEQRDLRIRALESSGRRRKKHNKSAP